MGGCFSASMKKRHFADNNKQNDDKLVSESVGNSNSPTRLTFDDESLDLKPTRAFNMDGRVVNDALKEKQKKFVIQPAGVNEVENAENAWINEHVKNTDMKDNDRELIRSALKRNFVCSSLNADEVSALLNSMKQVRFKANEIIVRQGEMGSHFFIIQHGTLGVTVNDAVVNTLTTGNSFGEVALIHNCARSATVKAKTESILWAVERGSFRSILMHLSNRNFNENRQFLESVKIFETLTDNQKNHICNSLVVEAFKDNHVIVRQGESGSSLYIVKQGKLQVSIGDKVVRTLSQGDYFGERALLYNEPRSATVVAVGDVILCSIAQEAVRRAFGDLEHVLYRNVLFSCLQSSKIFSQFATEQIEKLCETAIVRDFDANVTILDGEDKAQDVRLLVVLDGNIKIEGSTKAIKKGESIQKLNLNRGEMFGEEYVLDPSRKFSHKLHSETKCKVAILTSSCFSFVFGTEDVIDSIDYATRSQAVRRVFVFRYLSASQLELLVRAFQSYRQIKGDIIVQQGETGSRFFVIKSGEVAISKDGKHIRTSGKGDYFGERALLYDEPRSATVVAVSPIVELWSVDKSTFLQVIDSPMLKHLEERIRLQDTIISFDHLEVIKVVGRGTFGVVKLVRHKEKNTRYALKCVQRATVIKLQQQENVRLEREILAENDHPFIVKLVRTFQDNTCLYFLTELVTGGELYEAIRKLGLLSRSSAQFYLGSIILAIENLHERSILYRDLKPENVLLDQQGYIKLIDFGCAKKISGRTFTLVGTPHYMAPEVILGKGYTLSADLWSVGVCLYEFICGPLPYGNEAEDQLEIFREILMAPLTFPNYVTDIEALSLIRRLLSRSPEMRIGCTAQGFKELKEHPFFSDFNFDLLLSRSIVPPLVPTAETYAEDTETNANDFANDVDTSNVNNNTYDKHKQDANAWDAEF